MSSIDNNNNVWLTGCISSGFLFLVLSYYLSYYLYQQSFTLRSILPLQWPTLTKTNTHTHSPRDTPTHVYQHTQTHPYTPTCTNKITKYKRDSKSRWAVQLCYLQANVDAIHTLPPSSLPSLPLLYPPFPFTLVPRLVEALPWRSGIFGDSQSWAMSTWAVWLMVVHRENEARPRTRARDTELVGRMLTFPTLQGGEWWSVVEAWSWHMCICLN